MKSRVLSLAVTLMLFLGLAAPAVAAGIAQPVDYQFSADGANIRFAAYSAQGETYVRLRDMAHMLNHSQHQFNVDWDGQVISVDTGVAYTTLNGTELTVPFSGERAYVENPYALRWNGAEMALKTLFFTDDQEKGHTYVRPQDMIDLLGINVDQPSAGEPVDEPVAEPAVGQTELADGEYFVALNGYDLIGREGERVTTQVQVLETVTFSEEEVRALKVGDVIRAGDEEIEVQALNQEDYDEETIAIWEYGGYILHHEGERWILRTDDDAPVRYATQTAQVVVAPYVTVVDDYHTGMDETPATTASEFFGRVTGGEYSEDFARYPYVAITVEGGLVSQLLFYYVP